MRGYAASRIYPTEIIGAWDFARGIVAKIPDRGVMFEHDGEERELIDIHEQLRCHELARVVSALLLSPAAGVVDGKFGHIDHSWLIVDKFILDVYVPGGYPQVQLFDPRTPADTPHHTHGFRRTDIDMEMVNGLIRWFE